MDTQLNKFDLMILILNSQYVLALDDTCYCSTAPFCTTCETKRILRRLSKGTGLKLHINNKKQDASHASRSPEVEN
jgi:hypothetical protein